MLNRLAERIRTFAHISQTYQQRERLARETAEAHAFVSMMNEVDPALNFSLVSVSADALPHLACEGRFVANLRAVYAMYGGRPEIVSFVLLDETCRQDASVSDDEVFLYYGSNLFQVTQEGAMHAVEFCRDRLVERRQYLAGAFS